MVAKRSRTRPLNVASVAPLPSNIDMLLRWTALGHARRCGAEFANGADGFAIRGRVPGGG